MKSGRNIEFILVGVIVTIVLVGVGASWPGFAATIEARNGLEDLGFKMTDRPDRTDEVGRLTKLIAAIEEKMDREFRKVPAAPNVAGVVRALSVPVDGVTVRDQTFAAHAPVDAVPGADDITTRAMPLTVDMKATFDAVFALLRTTESMDRLVRVSSLRLLRDGGDEMAAGPPVLAATIGLEAVYDPVSGGEED